MPSKLQKPVSLILCLLIPLIAITLFAQNLAFAQSDSELATVVGRAVDGRTGESLENAQAVISMRKHLSSNEITRTLNSVSPTYSIMVEPGDWILRFEKLNNADYLLGYELKDISGVSGYHMSLKAGDVVTTNLTLFEEDASLSGTVTDVEGNPLGNHMVHFKGIGALDGVLFHGESDEFGQLNVDLPHGTYDVSLASGFTYPEQQDGVNPPPQRIAIEKGEVLNNFEIGYINSVAPLSFLVLGEGITTSREVEMVLENEFGDSHASVQFDLISDGENAAGYANITRGDNRIFKYRLYSEESGSEPKGKGMFEVAGPTQIVLSYEDVDPNYPWDGITADLITAEEFFLETTTGVQVEMDAGTVVGPDETRMWLHADVGEFPIQNGYFLVGQAHQFREVRTPAYPHFFAQNGPFSRPVTVTMPFDLSSYPALSSDDLKISIAYGRNAAEFFFQSDWFGWEYRSVNVDPITVDQENQTVTFLLEKPGSFGLVVPTQKFIDSVGFFPYKAYLPMAMSE